MAVTKDHEKSILVSWWWKFERKPCEEEGDGGAGRGGEGGRGETWGGRREGPTAHLFQLPVYELHVQRAIRDGKAG
jgi:hypothetical protein